MSALEIIMGVLLCIFSVVIVVVVLLQEGKSAGLSGAIAGGADTFFGKNKGRTIEQKLVKITRVVAIVFFVLVLATSLMIILFPAGV